jgi:nicotinamide-nucleotide amidase
VLRVRGLLSVEIVTIGTELLLGDIVDTNAAYVARALADHGVDVYAKHSVGDNAERLRAMLEGALARADGVVTTGGLGPTVDDLTKEAVAAAVGVDRELHEPSLRAIEDRLRGLGWSDIGENNRRQALLPRGAVVLDNPNGTAPGFIALRGDGKFVACMPGVPREMRPMLAHRLLPWLERNYQLGEAIFTRTLRTVGIGESALDRRIDELFRSSENPKIAMLAHGGRVDVKIMAKAADRAQADAMIAPLERELRARIADGIYGIDSETLEGAIVRACTERGWWIATAESVSGGALADALVGVPGASACFRGGVVAYDNAVKTGALGVAPEAIAAHGAVSEDVAIAMAQGARQRLGADIAISTTGVAGPSGGTPDKPLGLVWFGLATADETVARSVTFPGGRDDVRRRAVAYALNLLWRRLANQGPMRGA